MRRVKHNMMNKQIGNFGELREQVLGDRNYEGTV